jgi:hypothetical protein
MSTGKKHSRNTGKEEMQLHNTMAGHTLHDEIRNMAIKNEINIFNL